MADRKQDKHSYSTGQLFNFAQDSYLERTSRPIYAVVFLLPFIVVYELGTIFINTNVLNQSQIRVLAFVWLQNLLGYIGLGSRLAWAAPPLAVVLILIALQLASRKRWRFSVGDFWPMGIECVLLAVPLIVLGLFLNNPPKPQPDIGRVANSAIQRQLETTPTCSAITNDGLPAAAVGNEGTADLVRNSTLANVVQTGESSNGVKSGSLLADVVTGIGAGIYEELIFRLILICLLVLLFQSVLRLDQKNSIVFAVLVSAALFSAYHHMDFLSGQVNQTDPFSWTKFGFRTIAGVYFAVLFSIRGFGVTAGTHAFYDIIATVINAVIFHQ